MVKIENALISLYGILSVASFILLVILGGLFSSVQTVLFKEISYLISPFSSSSDISIPLFYIFLTNLLLFSLMLIVRLQNKLAKLGSLFLLFSTILGFFLIEFPQDPRGISQSFAGISHITVILIMGIDIIIALILLAYAFNKMKNLRWLSIYSIIVSLILMTAGFITFSFAILSQSQFVGLFEKIPIASFLLWILLLAVGILKSDKRIKYILNK